MKKLKAMNNQPCIFKKYHYYVLKKSAMKTSPTIREFILLQDREVSNLMFDRYVDLTEEKNLRKDGHSKE